MKKNRIRLTESQLHNVIKESIKRVLKEHGNGNPARNSNIKKLQDTVRYVAENLKSYYDFEEESKWYGYSNNGTCWQGRLYDDYGDYYDVLISNYMARVGTGNPHLKGIRLSMKNYENQ